MRAREKLRKGSRLHEGVSRRLATPLGIARLNGIAKRMFDAHDFLIILVPLTGNEDNVIGIGRRYRCFDGFATILDDLNRFGHPL